MNGGRIIVIVKMQAITTATHHLEALSMVITKKSKENENKIEALSHTLLEMNSKLDLNTAVKVCDSCFGQCFLFLFYFLNDMTLKV